MEMTRRQFALTLAAASYLRPSSGTDKKYSRNLGKEHGIDLFQV